MRIAIDTKRISILIFVLPLYACGMITEPVANKTLVDTEWDLRSFEVIGVGESDIGSQGMTLTFSADGDLEGKSRTIAEDLSMPGNSYGSTYEVAGHDSLSISNPWSTKVGLPVGSRYDEYLEAFHNSSSYMIEGKRLRIFYDDKTKALNFKAE